MMTRLLIASIVIWGVLLALRFFARTPVGRIAFSWLGPRPFREESWANYQFRWAIYSVDWLMQIILVSLILGGTIYYFPQLKGDTFPMAMAFALFIAGVMAVVAFCAFLVRSVKARFVGPNPIYTPELLPSEERRIDV